MTNFDKDKYRLYIPFKDFLALEEILMQKNIKYWIDNHLPNSVNEYTRFYFLQKDQNEINTILIENNITASDEFQIQNDTTIQQKSFMLYLKAIGILLIIMLIFIAIYTIFKD